MRYPDNLYSAIGDSDGEEFADQLSPSDGFTSPSSSDLVPHVPNVIVQDPTLQQQTEATANKLKAREASEEGCSSTQEDPGRYVSSGGAYWPGANNLSQESAVASFTQLAAGPSSSHTYSQPSASRILLRNNSSRGREPSIYPDAPPAYTPSPTSPLSFSSQPEHSRNYSTFSPRMGLPDVEQERLLAREPESMMDHPGDEESTTLVRCHRIGRQFPTWLNWKIVLLSLALLALSAGFLANAFRGIRGDKETPTSPQPPPQQPAQPVEEPEKPVTGSPNEPAWTPFEPVACKDAGFRYEDQVLPLVFNLDRHITFVEEGDEHTTGVPVRVAGHVQVRQTDEDGGPRTLLEVATSDDDLRVDVFVDENSQAMRVRVPMKFDSTKYPGPCVEMRATIFVPQGGEIGGFTVSATHLDVFLLEHLSLRVADFSKISSIVGDIASASSYPPSYEEKGVARRMKDLTFVPAASSYNFDSRVIVVSTTTGKIYGNWPLFDMLGLHSTSGDIKASITPKQVLESNPKPAVLTLTSVSGNIQAAEPIHGEAQIHVRDYLVDIKSTSGDLHLALAIGAGTHLESTSSDITVDLLPVINKARVTPDQPAHIETITTSGRTTVHILEPFWFDEDKNYAIEELKDAVPYVPVGNSDPYDIMPPSTPSGANNNGRRSTASATDMLDRIQALHKSTSGNIGLFYPQSWEGDLFAESMSGSLKVKGKDVKVVKSGSWPRSLHARKGDRDTASIIRIHSLSGNADATIGNVM